MTTPRLRLSQRLALRGLDLISPLVAGYRVPFMRVLVEQYGVRGAFARLGTLEKISKLLDAELGERDAHLLIGFASLYNGCRWCALGHIYAANLLHFRDTGRLLPLDELDFKDRLRFSDDRELLDFALAKLTDPAFAALAGLLERQFLLKTGAVPHPALGSAPAGAETERRDDLLAMAITAYDWLNHCSLVAENDEIVGMVAALHKDTALRRRYAAARGR